MGAKPNKKCLNCGETIVGRADKIFCNANCKSSYHFESRQQTEKKFFEVDKQLKTNRKILKKYNRNGMSTLRREVLHQAGFDPNYFTHYWKNKKGQVYWFTYDFGILKLKDNRGPVTKLKYLIVEWQEYMETNTT